MICKIEKNIHRIKMSYQEFEKEVNDCGYDIPISVIVMFKNSNMLPAIDLQQNFKNMIEDFGYKYGLIVQHIVLEENTIEIYSCINKNRKKRKKIKKKQAA